MSGDALIAKVALDAPLKRLFDYLCPPHIVESLKGGPHDSLAPGIRVRVPFGRRHLVGVLIATAAASAISPGRLKPILEVLDTRPIFDPATFDLLRFASTYYHHPLGEVIAAALPAGLRRGQSSRADERVWTVTAAGRREVDSPSDRRAPRQRALLAKLARGSLIAASQLNGEIEPKHLENLVARGWAARAAAPKHVVPIVERQSAMVATESQERAVLGIRDSLGGFAAHLLHGVTGSGKTEVYLRAIAEVLARDAQALVLVPEIALTPQLVARFRQRFSSGVAVLHSARSATERRDAWRAAYSGEARILIGTRSAIFASMPHLGLIVVDEEHDASYKQSEGFRYSARDLAVWRAQRAQVPIVLGSATPSLETLHNVAQSRYTVWSLPVRAGGACAPLLTLIDMRKHAVEEGLSGPAVSAIRTHLNAGGQIIVYLNRRGYAPALFCNLCGWTAACAHCDARMTLHRRAAELRCHHCGAREKIPAACATCCRPLHAVGHGTERVEDTLQRLFAGTVIARLDRDKVARKGAMESVLGQVRSGAARILVGTQMLSKGHDFPEVSLVVIVNADQGLFAADYRATERLAQTITQVGGRAGRGSRPGEVLIQTQFPENRLLAKLVDGGYESFAAAALDERQAARWPPYSHLALLRAEAKDVPRLDAFLRAAAGRARERAGREIKILGPASAHMARRADHFRAHLLIESQTRAAMQRFLSGWLPSVEDSAMPRGLRWSIDVDPLEVD